MEGSASPRNPWVAMACRSDSARSFEVAWRSRARSASSGDMPSPLSRTRMSCLPPASISTVTVEAPASSAFSTSSLTTDAGRSTTSPAAILLTRSSGSRSITVIGTSSGSYPLLAAEPPEKPGGDGDHEAEGEGIAVPPVQLRHVLEVHAVDAGDHGHRPEHGADRGQPLHGLVQAVVDDAEVRVEQALDHVVVLVRGVDDPVEVVVDVAEVDGGLRADDRELAPREPVHELPLRRADAPELADVALEVEDLLEDVGGLRREDLALDRLDALLEEVEVRVVPLEELVEDLIDEEVDAPRQRRDDATRALLLGRDHPRDRPLVVGDEIVAAEEHVELARAELAGLVLEADGVEDEEDVRVVVVDLGMVHVHEAVLDRERV